MSGNHQAVHEFWRRVSACVKPGDAVALLPHTAGLTVRNAEPGEEYEAVRATFAAVMRAAVAQADRRTMTDLVKRGYEPVSFEVLRQAAQDLGLQDTNWTRPETAAQIGRAVEALLVVAGEFTFEVSLVHRAQAEAGLPAAEAQAGAAPAVGAQQVVHYTLLALDGTDGAEVARAPLTYRWESLLPDSRPGGAAESGARP